MKNKIAVLVTLAMVSAPVMAQDFDKQVFANQNVKAVELSQTEMKKTQGEVAPIVALGYFGAGWIAHTIYNDYISGKK